MLKLQYFDHLMGRTNSLGKKKNDAGKDRRQRKKATGDAMIG